MGAYFLVECKNWKSRVDISVIRGLAHISAMKGNRAVLLFAGNGATDQVEQEIRRAVGNDIHILCITKEDLAKLGTKEDCRALLEEKWKALQGYADGGIPV